MDNNIEEETTEPNTDEPELTKQQTVTLVQARALKIIMVTRNQLLKTKEDETLEPLDRAASDLVEIILKEAHDVGRVYGLLSLHKIMTSASSKLDKQALRKFKSMKRQKRK